MVWAAIALGSNLGDRRSILSAAATALSSRLQTSSVSDFIETDAVGVGAQPRFLNGAIVGQWAGGARALLDLLMMLERQADRERPYPGAARTLDLDLILFGDAVIKEPDLIVPHPRFRERGFVLEPLAQLAPDMVDPVSGKTVAALSHAWREGKRPVRIALVQYRVGTDRAANIGRGLAAVREAAANGAKVVAFPELAFTPFFPCCQSGGAAPVDMAEAVPGPTTDAFCRLAAELGVVIVLNLYERDGHCAYDSSPVIDADGRLLGTTRMLHVAQMPHFFEQEYYTPGDHGMPVYETAAGRIGVAICYDRHYPEVMRSLGLQRADLVVVPQAGMVGEWPDGLYEAELRVAAFQNGYFTALANRVGVEPTMAFAGESFACDPSGNVIARGPAAADAIVYADLDLARLPSCHARQLFFRDRRPGIVAGLLGYADGLEPPPNPESRVPSPVSRRSCP